MKIRWFDRIYFYYDIAIKNLFLQFDKSALEIRPIWKVDKKLISLFFKIFYFLLVPIEAPSLISIPLTCIRLVIGIPLVLTSFIFIFLMILILGSIAGIFGFRNNVAYSFKEQIAAWIVVVIFLAMMPTLMGTYALFKVGTILAFIVLVLGIDFLYGYCGIVSLGHAAFVLLGGYFTAWFYAGKIGPGLPFVISILLGAIITAAIGSLIGILALRIKDQYIVFDQRDMSSSKVNFKILLLILIFLFKKSLRRFKLI
jgi:hypothetical protein